MVRPRLALNTRLFSICVVVIIMSSCGGGGGETSVTSTSTQTKGSVTLSWETVETNADGTPCADLSGYRIYYSESTPVTKNNSLIINLGTLSTIQINNLDSGKTYRFRISAYDQSGNESELSSEEKSKTIL